MDPASTACISSEKVAFHTATQWPLPIGLTETGSQMDWTRDAKIYDRLPKLEDKSGIDLQLSSIQGHCSPEVELPTTVDG